MKIAIATVQVPFITGGAEILTEMLKAQLIARGHQVDIVTIPFKWYPEETLLNCMMSGRMIDLNEVNGEKIDLVIAMKFPAYYVKHNNKIIWLMHQHRQAYDLWGTVFGDLQNMPKGEDIREMIFLHDNKYLGEAKRIYTISQNTSKRLMQYNKIESKTLYHPPLNYEKLKCEDYEDFIFYASRIDEIKRQRLLVEAALYSKTNVKIIIAGKGSIAEEGYLKKFIKDHSLEDKVNLVGFISEEEKINYYANCLAVYFGAYDEDYGYITLEGFYSKKAVIVHPDAGGPLEFVKNENNGYIVEADPRKIAKAIDELYLNKEKAKILGKNGYQSLLDKKVNWDFVINNLLMK